MVMNNMNEWEILSLGSCTFAKVTLGVGIWNLAVWEDSCFLSKAAKVTPPLQINVGLGGLGIALGTNCGSAG